MITLTSKLRQKVNFTATDELPVSVGDDRHAYAFYRNALTPARRLTFSIGTTENPIVFARWAIAKNDVVQWEYSTEETGDIVINLIDHQTIEIPAHTLTIPSYPYQYDIRIQLQNDAAPIIPLYGTLLVLEDRG